MDPSGRQITKIAREARRLALQTMRGEGIGAGEMDLLHLIRHKPGLSQKELCRELNLDKGAAARRVASLEQKGYLIRKPNPNDGRSQLLYATEQANHLKHSTSAVEAAFYQWLLETLPEEERRSFLQTLNRLYLCSKAESRAGYPNVTARLSAFMDEEDAK